MKGDSTTRNSIGKSIAALREVRGLTQRELAALTGYHYSNIAKIERGSYNVSIDILGNICSVLNAEIRIIAKSL